MLNTVRKRPEQPDLPRVPRQAGIAGQDMALRAGQVADLLKGCILVCHNAPFDLGFLSSEFARLGQRFEAEKVIERDGQADLQPEEAAKGQNHGVVRYPVFASRAEDLRSP